VFRDNYDLVYRVCYSKLRDPYDAEDAAQEVFFRAAKLSIPLREDPRPWLVQAAKTICIDEYRRRGKRWTELVEVDPGQTMEREDPERYVIDKLQIREMLACLTGSERKVVEEKWLQDRTHSQAGSTLGLSAGTTKVLLSRARRRLAAFMEGQGLGSVGLLAFGLRDRIRTLLRSAPEAAGLTNAATLGVTVTLVGAVSLFAGSELPAGTASRPHQASPAALAIASPSGPTSGFANAGAAQPARAWRQPSSPGWSPISLLPTRHAARPQDAAFTDIETSPNYPSDRTIYALGTDTSCQEIACAALFASSDMGATWTTLSARGLTSTELLLPRQVYSLGRGRLYAFGTNGLQESMDGGQSFTTAIPDLPGYAAVAPEGSPAIIDIGNSLGWMIAENNVPSRAVTFPPGATANGGPVFAESEGGSYVAYQPVHQQSLPGRPQSAVLACGSSACTWEAQLPWSWSTALRISPLFSTDQTLVAESAEVAISRDAGRTFQILPKTRLGALQALELLAHAGSLRMVGTFGPILDSAGTVGYSDDLGGTWERASLPPEVRSIEFIRWVGGDRIIAAAAISDIGRESEFICSADAGVTWRSCSAPG
jgi:RNA polymerase sigma-70 factor (ECF subfamily)